MWVPGSLKLNHSVTARNGPGMTERDVVSQNVFKTVLIH